MASTVAITTVDNPYNPFEEFIKWYDWDESHGYHSSGLLADLARTSYEFGDSLNETILQESVERIIELLGSDTYRVVHNDEA